MGTPLVSVIITAYNYGHMLGAALESALGQTYEHLEILVLDDASTDNTPDIVAAYAHDPRLRSVRNGTNLGVGRNTNRGLREARGEYVCYLSADDMLMPDFIATVMAYYAAHPHVDIVYGGISLTDAAGTACEDVPAMFPCAYEGGRNEFATTLACGCYMCFATLVVPRRIYDVFGGFDETITASDLDLLLRWSAAGVSFAHLPRTFVRVRVHAGQLSAPGAYLASGRDIREYIMMLERHLVPSQVGLIHGFERRITHMLRTRAALTFGAGYRDDGRLQAEVDAWCARLDEMRRFNAAQPWDAVISVIVLMRSSLADLERSLASLLTQSGVTWEALIVHDPSRSAAVEALLSRLGAPHQLRAVAPLRAETDAAALNLATAIAYGNCYAFMEAGDVFPAHHLAKIGLALHDRPCEIVVSETASHDTAEEIVPSGIDLADMDALLVAPRHPLASIAMRRMIIDTYRALPNASATISMWRFMLRMCCDNRPIALLSSSLVIVGAASTDAVRSFATEAIEDGVRETYRFYPVSDADIVARRERYVRDLSAAQGATVA